MYDDNITLSVCIPTYNQKELLRQLLNELVKYEGTDLEIVVSDNASTDGTWEMLQTIADPRLHLVKKEKNVEMIANAHIAWQKAVGKYRIFVKDRNYVHVDEIAEFISFAKQVSYDVIIAIGEKIATDDLNMQDKARLLWYLDDPGNCVYSYRIFDNLKSHFGFQKWSDEDWIKNSPLVREFFWKEILYSGKWGRYETARLSYNISDARIAKIKQHRAANDKKEKYYFLPENVEYMFSIFAGDRYIKKEDLEKCILGFYQEGVDRITYLYRYIVNSAYECKRYDYVPPKHINWVKVVNTFEKDIIDVLHREYEISNECYREIHKISLISLLKFELSLIMEYLAAIKNKVYPKPVFRRSLK